MRNRRIECRAARLSHDSGFTYVGLLIILAIIALSATATLQAGAMMQRRAAEEELLAIGKEFREALISYANATPQGQPRLPLSLQDLLRDPRYPNMRRHLRKLYADPITGKEEWGTLAIPGMPGIAGIYSLSEDKPIKIRNFDPEFQAFEDKGSYRDWQFMAYLPVPATRGQAAKP